MNQFPPSVRIYTHPAIGNLTPFLKRSFSFVYSARDDFGKYVSFISRIERVAITLISDASLCRYSFLSLLSLATSDSYFDFLETPEKRSFLGNYGDFIQHECLVFARVQVSVISLALIIAHGLIFLPSSRPIHYHLRFPRENRRSTSATINLTGLSQR